MSKPSPFFLDGGALNKRNFSLTVFCLIIATLWNTSSVSGAPAKLDPIVVALPDGSPDTFTTNAGPSSFSSSASSSPADTTTVDVESVPLVEVETNSSTAQSSKNNLFVPSLGNFQGLPEYILDLNDPDIAGPVDYIPDNKGLKVIAWDLLPPYENNVEANDKVNSEEPEIITLENSTPRTIKGVEDPISHNIKVTLSTGVNPQTTPGQVSVVDVQPQYSQTSQTIYKPEIGSRSNVESTTKPNYTQQNRGSVYFSSTTQRPTTTTTSRTTTTTLTTSTTPRTTITTTPRTTTTRITTTPRTTLTTTTAESDRSEFFKLEAGDSYTLPPWLQDIDDPELDVAVTYIVPEDINQYNHTIDRDILPPFEPYTDLNIVHLTPPTVNVKETTTNTQKITSTTTPRTSSTTAARRTTITSTAKPTLTSTTTRTTKRPTLSTYQPHWIRAKPTTSPTQSTFYNHFATSFSHNQGTDNQHVPSIDSSNFAQNTRTTTTTTSTTVKPKTTVNYYNRPLSNTPKTDKIASNEETSTPQKSQNPFLPTYNNGAYRPQSYSTTTRRTTTTTTTAAPEVHENPFEPTIPPWLKDFDYADVGPGVPFVYDPNEDESPVDKEILPPSETSETKLKPSFITSPSSSTSFVTSQTPQGFTNKFSTSATSLTSSSSIPSKVTIPLPSIQKTQNQDDDSTVTQPPLVFVPPPPTAAEDIIANADDITKKTSSSFNTNFAAPFDPTTSTTSTSDDAKKVPLGADRESFPPFNNAVTEDVTGTSIPSKTTFSKSEDGKVITNNVFLNGATATGASYTKPFAAGNDVNNQQKGSFATQSSTQFSAEGFSGSTFTKATTASTSFKQFGTTSAGASGFVTSGGAAPSSFGSTSFGSSSSSGTVGGSKYTGRFGGPPGVLAPQSSGFTSAGFTTASPVTKTYNRPAATTSEGIAATSTNNKNKFTGSFGGPPGVLTPYDNVKNRN